MREADDVVDVLGAERGDRPLGRRDGVGEPHVAGVRVDGVRPGRDEAERPDPDAVLLEDAPRADADGRAEDVAVPLDVRTDPRLRCAVDEFERAVGAVIEVVVAERVGVRVGPLEEVERLLAAGQQRQDSRRGVVAGAEHERVVVPASGDGAGESPQSLGVVVGVLDVRVVEEPEGHTALSNGGRKTVSCCIGGFSPARPVPEV
jgi:hypothetical protein